MQKEKKLVDLGKDKFIEIYVNSTLQEIKGNVREKINLEKE